MADSTRSRVEGAQRDQYFKAIFFVGSLPIASLKVRFEESIPVVSPFPALHMMTFSAGGARSARYFWAAFRQ